MKFYYSPGACSLGIHFLLEEIGIEYEGIAIHIKNGDQLKDAYLQINPKSKVPAVLRDDGSLLTEFGVIAHWLTQTHARAQFEPESFEQELRTRETLDYIVATMHMQGFTRILRPQKFTPNDGDHAWVQTYGTDIAMKAAGFLSAQLGDKAFIMGERMSIADAALFYTMFWSVARLKLDLPTNLIGYFERMSARPAAQKAMQLEGLI
ncbi:glutathione S-transferase family protein [Pseudosulfitobacter pseudonitzschiae]|uniref:glutathione S-transferase family protein n=1 Tax=Pseudosulfitobacter pseudonitzschiae TaxID=1402135 RepID=UPI001AF7AAC4|nr:glutathione S-transferase C-terminal domain-containing protein [Pseudosulfitobacter pseudonitzschiae]MBM1815972.1 glutathione S-transferase N-terminal domain-containing protein [Pseudosulfitobacter pseudonitzschiae]MBM1833278.1 glutathione S-transferase N-terminal domain-containing protein [Pseudosulfitobacter pseudonitzschiae]MBM1838145.1 glutathione S-transferase N-terminal domain-containing protein [Pseudosulfitobacter pseudonitzschiae]MBM1842677.1 glutathione S-transferase N-terminal dom